MSDIWTRVEICFFKPEGYASIYYVNSEDRGAAARKVMDLRVHEKQLRFLNYIDVKYCPAPQGKEAEFVL